MTNNKQRWRHANIWTALWAASIVVYTAFLIWSSYPKGRTYEQVLTSIGFLCVWVLIYFGVLRRILGLAILTQVEFKGLWGWLLNPFKFKK